MKSLNDLPGWLHRCNCPAFSVKENIITACNQAAEALLLSSGMDVRELLLTGAEEAPVMIDPVVPEDAAEDIAEDIGPVNLPVHFTVDVIFSEDPP